MKLTKLLLLCTLTLFKTSYSQNLYEKVYQWKIPGGNYIDETSFFSLHGYVNSVYAFESEDWQEGNFNAIGAPGQVLVPNTNNGSFQSDEALWISSEISEKVSALMELHMVTAPSGVGAAGPGGLTLVLTEANVKVKFYKKFLNVACGTFWNPFGIHNVDWLGGQNLFTTIPYASAAFPTHYNEKGLRVDGCLGNKDKIGMNYVVSIGNGYNAWDISGYQAIDNNHNKTVTGRISLFPGLKEKLNIGFSFASGHILSGDTSLSDTTKEFYDNSFKSVGTDLMLTLDKFRFRSYAIYSTKVYESLKDDLEENRFGIMGEVSYRLNIEKDNIIESFEPKLRFDFFQGQEFRDLLYNQFSSISIGSIFNFNDNSYISVDYNFLNERDKILKNDRLIIRITAKF